jgi:hypothetical protein
VVLEEGQLENHQCVYVYKCENAFVEVKGKVNSVQVVACKKVDIMFTSVIASVDVTNSSGVQLQTSGNMPCAFVEKSHDVMVFLSKEAMETTSITTCASTGVNVTMPPKAEGEDPVEGALPEQYITKIVGGKLVTVPTEHKA